MERESVRSVQGRRVLIQPVNGEVVGLEAGAAVVLGWWTDCGGKIWSVSEDGRYVLTADSFAAHAYCARRLWVGLPIGEEPVLVQQEDFRFLLDPAEILGPVDSDADGLVSIDVAALGGEQVVG